MFNFTRRGTEPYDVRVGQPNPSSWGKPYAYFTLGANCPSNHFNHLSMVALLQFFVTRGYSRNLSP